MAGPKGRPDQDFDAIRASLRETRQSTSFTFRLGGKKFRTATELPSAEVIGTASRLRAVGDPVDHFVEILNLMPQFIRPEDRRKFEKVVLSTEQSIDPAVLMLLFWWLCSLWSPDAEPETFNATAPDEVAEIAARLGGQVAM